VFLRAVTEVECQSTHDKSSITIRTFFHRLVFERLIKIGWRQLINYFCWWFHSAFDYLFFLAVEVPGVVEAREGRGDTRIYLRYLRALPSDVDHKRVTHGWFEVGHHRFIHNWLPRIVKNECLSKTHGLCWKRQPTFRLPQLLVSLPLGFADFEMALDFLYTKLFVADIANQCFESSGHPCLLQLLVYLDALHIDQILGRIVLVHVPTRRWHRRLLFRVLKCWYKRHINSQLTFQIFLHFVFLSISPQSIHSILLFNVNLFEIR